MSGPTHTVTWALSKTERTMLDFGTQCSENKISLPLLFSPTTSYVQIHDTDTEKTHKTTTATDGTTHFRWHEMHDVNERIDEGRSLYLAKPTQSLLFYCFLLAFHRFMTSDTAPKKRKQHRFTACLARSEHTTIEFGRDQRKKKKKETAKQEQSGQPFRETSRQ